jgi:hypothetical protein
VGSKEDLLKPDRGGRESFLWVQEEIDWEDKLNDNTYEKIVQLGYGRGPCARGRWLREAGRGDHRRRVHQRSCCQVIDRANRLIGSFNPDIQTGRRMNRCLVLVFAAACFSFFGCGGKKDDTAATTNYSSGNPITAPVDYVGAIGQAHKTTQNKLGGLGLDQALKAFYAEEGRYPATLDELVSKGTVSSVPKPPAGMKYDYDPKAGTIKVVPQ